MAAQVGIEVVYGISAQLRSVNSPGGYVANYHLIMQGSCK